MKVTRLGVLIGSSAALLACSSSPPPAGGTDAGPPAVLRITSPAPGSRVVLSQDADRTTPIGFTVQNLNVAPQGQCGGTATCAHVEVFIDGNACNAGGRDNAEGGSSPVKAKLAKCSMPAGMHTIRLELHYDDYEAVVDASNQTVSSEVVVAALAPTVAITAPDAGATVTLGPFPGDNLSIDFDVHEFTLMTPGTCPTDSQGVCGSVFLLIDGSACNGKPGGIDQGYNNLLLASPGTAVFGQCRTPTGQHTVILELHNDDKSPLKDSSGNTLSASVSVTAQ
jgi:hypothetical protein